MLELAEKEGAIVIDPAYRLIPEVNGSDVLDDIEEFWTWVHMELPGAIKSVYPDLSVNLERVAACGESAGGYLSLQSALLFPQSKISVVMAQYPSMFPDLKAYNQRLETATPQEDQFITDYAKEHKGKIRLGSKFPWNPELMVAMANTGRHRQMLGDDPRLTFGHCLRTANQVPPIWIAQGVDDHIVSIISASRAPSEQRG